MNSPAKSGSKLLYLDVMRGAAMAIVFMLHLYGASYWPQISWSGNFRDFGAAYHKSMLLFYPYTLGHLGVALFFVLSGYCIHLSFLNYAAKRSSFTWPEFLKVFFIRRFFRIYPAYFAAVLFFFFWSETHLKPDWPVHLISHLTFLHNARHDTYGSLNGAFWSLAYEWQLYCLYPFILLLRSKIGIFRTFVAVSVVSFLYTFLFARMGDAPLLLQDGVIRSKYLFTWMLGAYLCEAHAQGRQVFPSSSGLLMVAGIAALALSEYRPALVLEWEVFAVIFAWTLERYRTRLTYTRLEKSIAGIGVISYSIYLMHGPLIEFFIHGPTGKLLLFGYPYSQMTISGFLFIFGPIVALSWITYRSIEKPFHELGVKVTSRPNLL